MTKIKTGIIGTGFIGPAHVEALRRLGFVEVVAVAERGEELADAKAKALSIPKAYGDYQAAARRSGDSGRAQLHAESFALCDQQGDHRGRQARRLGEAAGDESPSRRAGAAGEGGGRGERDQFQLSLHAAGAAGASDVQVGRRRGPHPGGAWFVSAGLAAVGERLELAAGAGVQRRLAGGGRHRLALVRPGAVHHGAEDCPRDGRPGDDPSDAEAAEGRSRNLRRQGAAAGRPRRRADQHGGLRLDPAWSSIRARTAC